MMKQKSAETKSKNYVCHHKEVWAGMVPCEVEFVWIGKSLHYNFTISSFKACRTIMEPRSALTGTSPGSPFFIIRLPQDIWYKLEESFVLESLSLKEDIGNGECCYTTKSKISKNITRLFANHPLFTTRLGVWQSLSTGQGPRKQQVMWATKKKLGYFPLNPGCSKTGSLYVMVYEIIPI